MFFLFILQETVQTGEKKKKKRKDRYVLADELSVLKVGFAGNSPALGGCVFSALSDLLRSHCPPQKGLRTTCALSYSSYVHSVDVWLLSLDFVRAKFT